MADKVTQTSQRLKDYEAEQTLLLKEEKVETVDAKGNPKVENKYTEIQIKSLIQQGKQGMVTELNVDTLTLDKIDGKIKAVFNYITLVRDQLRPTVFINND